MLIKKKPELTYADVTPKGLHMGRRKLSFWTGRNLRRRSRLQKIDTNDIALITLPDGRRPAIAFFVSDSTADDAAPGAVIARIAKAAYDEAVQTKKWSGTDLPRTCPGLSACIVGVQSQISITLRQ
jgi:hypothetical protein